MDIITITARFFLNVGVNCYLIRCGESYVLIDTGMASRRRAVEQALAAGRATSS